MDLVLNYYLKIFYQKKNNNKYFFSINLNLEKNYNYKLFFIFSNLFEFYLH